MEEWKNYFLYLFERNTVDRREALVEKKVKASQKNRELG